MACIGLLGAVILFLSSCVATSADTGVEKQYEPINGAWLEENLDDVTLELYYMSPNILTRTPLSEDDLMRTNELHITARGGTIWAHKDLISQMLDTSITPVDNPDEVYLNARVYYTLCDKDGKTRFKVAIGGLDTVFVNGVPCVDDPIFYAVPMEFLPTDIVAEFRAFYEV